MNAARLVAPSTLVAVAAAALLIACSPPEAATTQARRFEVHAIQTPEGPTLFRFDTATGELMRSELPDGSVWEPIGAPAGGAAADQRPGRYALDYVQAPSIPLTFVRVDTAGGLVWRMRFPRDRSWVTLRTPGAPAEAPPAPAPSPRLEPRPEPERSARSPGAPGRTKVRATTKQDVDAFVEAVTSLDLPTDMRAWAVEQLGNGPTEHAVGPLIDILGDPDDEVVRTAARALGKHDDPRVRPALEGLSNHRAPAVQRAAAASLQKLD